MYNTPKQIVEIVSDVAKTKAASSTSKTLILAFLAGALGAERESEAKSKIFVKPLR